jgi:hypothetical protein
MLAENETSCIHRVMIAVPEKPEPLKIVTLHCKGYGDMSNTTLETFTLFEKRHQLLNFVRLQPGGRYGNVRDMLRVWTVTLLKGSVTVKVGRKKMLLEPFETAIIQPGPPRSITNQGEHGIAEFLVAGFPET